MWRENEGNILFAWNILDISGKSSLKSFPPYWAHVNYSLRLRWKCTFHIWRKSTSIDGTIFLNQELLIHEKAGQKSDPRTEFLLTPTVTKVWPTDGPTYIWHGKVLETLIACLKLKKKLIACLKTWKYLERPQILMHISVRSVLWRCRLVMMKSCACNGTISVRT